MIHRYLQSIGGLSGQLHTSPLGSRIDFSFRIVLIGYSGSVDDVMGYRVYCRWTFAYIFKIGTWHSHKEVQVNLSRDSRAQLLTNVRVSDELKPHFRVTTIIVCYI